MFGVRPRTLYYWYKEYLSDYRKQIAEGKWGDKKIFVVDKDTGEVIKEKPVPIAKPENMGSHMTIDEKWIGKKTYTLMTNIKTGKIALLAQSHDGEELQQVIQNYFSEKQQEVKSVSSDMNATYKKLCKEMFPNCQVVIDKFHVIKHLLDALQQVRKEIKNECLNNPLLQVNPVSMENHEQEEEWTEIELLERARYPLYKNEMDWEGEETLMMNYLFSRYPTLKKAYDLTQKLREWYDRKYIGVNRDFRERDLDDWCDDVVQSKIPAFRAVRKMIEKHYDDIVNYFKEGHTNAKAENMNGKIQRFLANNFGIRNKDFFFFRLAGYFS